MAICHVLLLFFAVTDAASNVTHDFMVMGDWGGVGIWPYKTPGEVGVASQLGKLAGEVRPSYTLSLGDNFYFAGVKSADDKRFRETFEDVFTSEHVKGPNHFRVVAGNHDHHACHAFKQDPYAHLKTMGLVYKLD